MAYTRTLPERLWDKVVERESGCWEFTGAKARGGYGQIGLNGTAYQTHRVAYAISVAPLKPGDIVRHTCDNPPCVRPAHLQVGTQVDNMRDKMERGRWRGGSPPGEAQGLAKLTDAGVREMRVRFRRGETQLAIAAAFGVRVSTAHNAIRRKTWNHVA